MTGVTKEASVEDCAEFVRSAVLATLPAVVLMTGSSKFLRIQAVAEAFAFAFYVFHIIGPDLPAGLDQIGGTGAALISRHHRSGDGSGNVEEVCWELPTRAPKEEAKIIYMRSSQR
jgi:hypothetical protein